MILQFDLGDTGYIEINLDKVSGSVVIDGKMAANVPLVALRKLLAEQIARHGWDRTVAPMADIEREVER